MAGGQVDDPARARHGARVLSRVAARRPACLAALGLAVAVALAGCGGGGAGGSASTYPGWRGDFETGDLSQWHDVRRVADDRITVVSSPVRQGRYAARFEVRPGDRISTGERAEVLRDPSGGDREGQSAYYGWSTLFPTNWTEPRGWGIVLQFHSLFHVSPPLAIDARADTLYVEGRGGQFDHARSYRYTILPRLAKGVWHDLVMYVHWDRAQGVVRIWHKLSTETTWRLVVDARGVGNIQTDQGVARPNDLRVGLYRDRGGDNTDVVFQDAMHKAATFRGAAAGMSTIVPPDPAAR